MGSFFPRDDFQILPLQKHNKYPPKSATQSFKPLNRFAEMDFLRRSVVDNMAYHVLPTNGDVEGLPPPVGVSSTTHGQANGSSSHNGEPLNGDRLAHKEGYVPSSTDSVNVLPTWIWESLDLPAWMQYSEHIPSFKNSPKTPQKLHPTAWLDGLRGIASLCVVFHHSSVLWYLSLNNGWGCDPGSRKLVQ